MNSAVLVHVIAMLTFNLAEHIEENKDRIIGLYSPMNTFVN